MATGAPSEVTEAAFSRWKVELQNKLPSAKVIYASATGASEVRAPFY